MSKLTNRELMFCNEYLNNGFKQNEAAIAAGFKETAARVTACRLMKQPNIKNYINGKIKKLTARAEITFEYKLDILKKVIDCSIYEKDGQIILENYKAVLGAISELNKMQGHYKMPDEKDKKDELMTREEAEEMMKKYRREL